MTAQYMKTMRQEARHARNRPLYPILPLHRRGEEVCLTVHVQTLGMGWGQLLWVMRLPGSPMTNRTDEGQRRSKEVDTHHVAVGATAT